MSGFRRNTWELCCSVVLLPPLLVTWWNADVLRLAVGVFGPPPGVFIVRWLLVGAVLAAVALQQRAVKGTLARSRWLMALATASLIACGRSLWRDRGFRTREVRFSGPGISIAATLYEPASGEAHAAVVLVHGSAPLKRGFYGLWAEQIARSGIAVLVPDKRGVGSTGGDFERNNNTSRENIMLLARDAVAAVNFAATQPGIDSTRIGLFGLSQAGWVAPMAATLTHRVRFLALITSPTVSVREEGTWSEWRGDENQAGSVSRVDAERMMDTVSRRGVDARSLLGSLDIPGLWLFGADDNSIPTVASVRALDSLTRTGGKRFTSSIYAGAGHLLFTRRLGPVPQVEPASWARLMEWLASTTALHAAVPEVRAK